MPTAESPRPSPARIAVAKLPAWLVSAAGHFAMLILLALIPIATKKVVEVALMTGSVADIPDEIEFIPENSMPLMPDVMPTSSDAASAIHLLPSMDVPDVIEPDGGAFEPTTEVASIDPGIITGLPVRELGTKIPAGDAGGGALGNRSGPGKAAAISQYGTPDSEAAVARALEWLAAHQLPDGGWSFEHRGGACNGRCANPGEMKDCRTGATGLALLPFLGAGNTHKVGKYKKNVEAGLYFLVSQMKVQGNRGDLAQGGGNLYSHGIATIALCEAYAMTHDKSLASPAQYALNHIVFAQDPVGGGWRYHPKQAGDTSVVGWQLMALKSGHMAYLNVPPQTIAGAMKFLDSVQAESGARYGYTDPGGGAGTTSVGLLCRMYLGWKHDHPALERGVDFLSKTGPSRGNFYYNYYATQVLHHYSGEKWDRWNKELRESLVQSQERQGHSTGSWYFTAGGDHGAAHGGRLYYTALSTMILEVYYRLQPIYGKPAAEDDFPLR